jgi:hypothetical protein
MHGLPWCAVVLDERFEEVQHVVSVLTAQLGRHVQQHNVRLQTPLENLHRLFL